MATFDVFAMETLRAFTKRHEALKQKIHNFRIPLSKRGQIIMGCVYFSAPLLAGYFLLNAVNERNQKLFDAQVHPIHVICHQLYTKPNIRLYKIH